MLIVEEGEKEDDRLRLLIDDNDRLKKKIDDLERENRALVKENSKVVILDHENTELKKKLAECKASNAASKSEINSLRIEISKTDRLHLGNQEKSREINQIRSNLEIAKEDNKSLHVQCTFLAQELESANKRIAQQNAKASESEGDLLALKSKISDLERKNKHLKEEADEREDDFRSQLQSFNEVIENMKQEAREKMKDANNKTLSNDAVISEINSLKSQIEDYKKTISELETEIHRLKATSEENKEHQMLLGNLSSMNNQGNSDLREMLLKAERERDQLLARLDKLSIKDGKDDAKINDLSEDITELKERCHLYEDKIGEMEEIINNLEDENEGLQGEVEELRTETILIEKEYEKLKFELENNTTLEMMREENENLKRLNDQLRTELDNGKDNVSHHSGYSQLSRKVDYLEGMLNRDSSSSTAPEEIRSLRRRNQTLEEKLKQMEKKKDRWSKVGEDLKLIKVQVAQNRSQVAMLERDKENLLSAKHALEKELEAKKELINQLDSEVDEWKSKCDHLQNMLSMRESEGNIDLVAEIEGLKQRIDEKEEEIMLWEQEAANLQEQLALFQDEEGYTSQEMNKRISELDEELRYTQEENEKLRQENEEYTTKFEAVEDFIQDNETLKEILRNIREKLEFQVEAYDVLWKRANRELELKNSLKEEISTKLTQIFNNENTPLETKGMIEKLQIEVFELKENKSRADNHIEELEHDIELMREDITKMEQELEMGYDEESHSRSLH